MKNYLIAKSGSPGLDAVMGKLKKMNVEFAYHDIDTTGGDLLDKYMVRMLADDGTPIFIGIDDWDYVGVSFVGNISIPEIRKAITIKKWRK